MAQIMCTDRLWKALSHARRLPVDATGAVTRAVLGDWAATVVRLKHRELVLALNARTWLTLVFPLSPRVHFRDGFVTALGHALEDHRQIGTDAAVRECAEVELARIERLSDPELRLALDIAEFMCGVEMEYDEDLRRVQWNQNQVPHRKAEPCVPSEALLALFGAPTAVRRWDRDLAAVGRRGWPRERR